VGHSNGSSALQEDDNYPLVCLLNGRAGAKPNNMTTLPTAKPHNQRRPTRLTSPAERCFGAQWICLYSFQCQVLARSQKCPQLEAKSSCASKAAGHASSYPFC